jgi:hypothetical protein
MRTNSNRKLGIIVAGTSSLAPFFNVSGSIDNGLNEISSSGVESITKTGEFNIILKLSMSPNAETEWPKPCEYFKGSIIGSDFPYIETTNEISVPIPYVIASGVSGYNIIQNILNTESGSSTVISGSFLENNLYEFFIGDKITSGDITFVAGNIISPTPNVPSFQIQEPILIGNFILEISGQDQRLNTFFNQPPDFPSYYIISDNTEESITYQFNNTVHFCGGGR